MGSAKLPILYLESAPQVRLELTTLRLTAGCSAIELLRNKRLEIIAGIDAIFIANRLRERQAIGSEMRRSAGKACLLRFIVLVLL